jgi:hypothetical protein
MTVPFKLNDLMKKIITRREKNATARSFKIKYEKKIKRGLVEDSIKTASLTSLLPLSLAGIRSSEAKVIMGKKSELTILAW